MKKSPHFVFFSFCLMFSSFILMSCGPEMSVQDQQRQQVDENERLAKQKLLDQASLKKPQIEKWVGCYKGVYTNESREMNVIVSLVEWFYLVSPSGASDPVEMPMILGSMKPSKKTSSDYQVSFTGFSSNDDASKIVIQKSGSQKTYMSLSLEPIKRHHSGLYETDVMPPRFIKLTPVEETVCED